LRDEELPDRGPDALAGQSATLAIVKGNDLKPEDIKEIRIESIARAADILSDPAKYDPQSKESADHSCRTALRRR
jgi:2-methylcitrate dehydratase PrpD